MKIDRLIWGILFLFVGGVLLLDNFDVITFYWRNVWQFWPIILIILGVNVLLGKKESNIGGIISIGILVVTLGYLFYRGQQPLERNSWVSERFGGDWNFDDESDTAFIDNAQRQLFTEPMANESLKSATLNLNCGGTSVYLEETSDSLFTAAVSQRAGSFLYNKEVSDTSATVNLRMKDNKKNFKIGKGGSNRIELKLNPNPFWNIDMHMGAGGLDMDLTAFKIRSLSFEGGAASADIKLGDKAMVTTVHIKTGVAEVNIKVPKGSGCQIISKTGLSSTDYNGFDKKEDGVYETANFATATHKIYLTFDGGLSSFDVTRY